MLRDSRLGDLFIGTRLRVQKMDAIHITTTIVCGVGGVGDGRVCDRLDWRGIADAGQESPASPQETLSR